MVKIGLPHTYTMGFVDYESHQLVYVCQQFAFMVSHKWNIVYILSYTEKNTQNKLTIATKTWLDFEWIAFIKKLYFVYVFLHTFCARLLQHKWMIWAINHIYKVNDRLKFWCSGVHSNRECNLYKIFLAAEMAQF